MARLPAITQQSHLGPSHCVTNRGPWHDLARRGTEGTLCVARVAAVGLHGGMREGVLEGGYERIFEGIWCC